MENREEQICRGEIYYVRPASSSVGSDKSQDDLQSSCQTIRQIYIVLWLKWCI